MSNSSLSLSVMFLRISFESNFFELGLLELGNFLIIGHLIYVRTDTVTVRTFSLNMTFVLKLVEIKNIVVVVATYVFLKYQHNIASYRYCRFQVMHFGFCRNNFNNGFVNYLLTTYTVISR